MSATDLQGEQAITKRETSGGIVKEGFKFFRGLEFFKVWEYAVTVAVICIFFFFFSIMSVDESDIKL